MKCTKTRDEHDFSYALGWGDGERLRLVFGLLVEMPDAYLSTVA
jgi:hypothetical protein